MTESTKLDNAVHKLRGLLHVLSNFVDSLEHDNARMPASDVKEYCSIVIESLHEVEGLIEAIKNDTN
jgi:hypothetical protein